MQVIELETEIAAPPERCFLLSLSVDLHLQNMAHTDERAISGVTHGILGHSDTVTWRGRHFGLMFHHKAVISRYEPPHYFQDVMVEGMFTTFIHDHRFHPSPTGTTIMRDDLRFAAPLRPLGSIAEALVLRPYLAGLLAARNQHIKQVAESSEAWMSFLRSP